VSRGDEAARQGRPANTNHPPLALASSEGRTPLQAACQHLADAVTAAHQGGAQTAEVFSQILAIVTARECAQHLKIEDFAA
jgi:hypothetical protein